MKDVFISYKAEEIEEAGWVKSVLESNGISCWMAPSCIPGGSSYAVEIPNAIRQAKVFVLVLSSKAQDSQWVSREVDLAINEGKIVLPFMLENCALKDDFNFYLTNVQRYSAYENKVAAMEKMIREIKAIVGSGENELVIEKPPVTSKKTEKKAKEPKVKTDICCILSGVFAVISVIAGFGMYIVPNILAMVFAFLGLKNVEKNQTKGKKLALEGFIVAMVCNLVGFTMLLSVIGFVIAAAIDLIFGIKFFKKYKTLD